MTERTLIYAHIGDLHLTGPDEQNARDLAAIVAELTSLGDALDFVFVPGDNADNGRPEQYALAKQLLEPLPVPVHIITGDHDMEGGSLDAFHASLGVPTLPKAVDVAGVRCLFLDISGPGQGGPDFRIGSAQQRWIQQEIEAANGGRCAIFMHSYPADLVDEAEREAVKQAIASPAVLLVDMGHTHYNEISNDGRTLFAATRSTGQIEEGSAGYSLITIDNRSVSWRFRKLGTRGPIVLMTAPVDRRLATDATDSDHAPLGTDASVRASVLYPGIISSCACRVDDGAPVPMRLIDHGRYEAVVPIPPTARSLQVEARSSDGSIGVERIEFARADDFTVSRHADGSDADAIGAWPQRGILGTQLGPNRNGRQW